MRISESLGNSKGPIGNLSAPAKPGVYAIYSSTMTEIGGFPIGRDGLAYVGFSEVLASREFDQHFCSGETGFSTLRRSLGAILKSQLNLTAIPRSPGSAKSSYRFLSDGEERLSQWMESNLEVSVLPIINALEVESDLIPFLEPVLNLTKWKNPHRKEIKRLRAICASEAQRQQR